MSIKKQKSKENNVEIVENSKDENNKLDAIRSKIDIIDDNLHKLLIERGKLVEEVSSRKKITKNKNLGIYRPDREYSVLSRIISKHEGSFPLKALIAVWKELFSGYRSMQGDLTVSYIEKYDHLLRNHFGSCAIYVSHKDSDTVLGSLLNNNSQIAALPFPTHKDRWCLKFFDFKNVAIIGSVKATSSLRSEDKLLLLGKQNKIYSCPNNILILISVESMLFDKVNKYLKDLDYNLLVKYTLDNEKLALLVTTRILKEEDINKKMNQLIIKKKLGTATSIKVLGAYESERFKNV